MGPTASPATPLLVHKRPPVRPASWAVAPLVVAAGVGLAAAFAWQTPPWQAPDEPAHANYVAQVVLLAPAWPRIDPGDWDAIRVAEVQNDAMAPFRLQRTGLSYEDHQPPLYYAVVAPWFASWRGAFGLTCRTRPSFDLPDLTCEAAMAVFIRWFSLPLCLATLVATCRAVGTAFVPDTRLPAAVTAFVGFVPMSAYMAGSTNNDALANLVMAVALLTAVRRLAGRTTRRRYVAWAGLVWGAALLTKLTVYPVILPLAAAEVLRTRREGEPLRAAVAAAATSAAVGLLIAAPWFVRNMRVYGLTDPFGLAAHDRVVVGQPRTADWIAQHGWGAYLERGVVFTFDSFWGVFGWMSTFLDRRIYAVLAVASVVMAIGFAGYVRRAWRAARAGGAVGASDAGGSARAARGGDAGPLQRDVLVVFGLVAFTTVAGFVWYNLSFVQHQGRYLFPALIPIATAAMLGVREWARWLAAAIGRPRWTDGLAAVGMAAFNAGLLATSIWALRHAIPTLWPGG